jgi:hypothetical protein
MAPENSPAAPPPPSPIDRTTAWLAGLAVLHLVATIAAVIWLPNNEKLYALLAAQSSGYSGALLLRLKG